MIVDSGLNLIRDGLFDGRSIRPTHMGIGTGRTLEVAGDTTLQTEIMPNPPNRNAISAITALRNVIHRMTLLATEANTHALSEIGLFNAPSGGIMLSRITFLPITKTSAFVLRIEVSSTLRDV